MATAFETAFANFTTATAFALAGCAIIWFFQTRITEQLRAKMKFEYDSRLEKDKQAYLQENSSLIERLKADLQSANSENHFRFSKLHEKVADFISEIYARFSKVMYFANTYVDQAKRNEPKENRYENIEKITDEMMEFESYFNSKLLYLDANVSKGVEELFEMIRQSLRELLVITEDIPIPPHPSDVKRSMEEIVTKIEAEIPKLLESLRIEFRKILGAK